MAVAGLLAQGASGLYADEVGKLDWHRQNLGRFSSAAFDGRGGVTVVGEVSLALGVAAGLWWVGVGASPWSRHVSSRIKGWLFLAASYALPVSSRG